MDLHKKLSLLIDIYCALVTATTPEPVCKSIKVDTEEEFSEAQYIVNGVLVVLKIYDDFDFLVSEKEAVYTINGHSILSIKVVN